MPDKSGPEVVPRTAHRTRSSVEMTGSLTTWVVLAALLVADAAAFTPTAARPPRAFPKRAQLTATAAATKPPLSPAPALAVSASAGVVAPPPRAPLPFERRAAAFASASSAAASAAPSTIRVVSYNVLADMHATSTFALEVLYPYVHPSLLEEEYRQQLIAAELLALNADVICLQEVTGRMFSSYLEPQLLRRGGYRGVYSAKCGSTPEGCAV